jgi:hypothetical protein
MPSPEEKIRVKTKLFQECAAQARWDDLVTCCYTRDANLAHFLTPETLEERDSILKFFKSNEEGYDLDLRYTVTSLKSDPSARLVSGVGRVNAGAWCPFVERWEDRNGDWLIVKDKVYPPETWME